MAEPSLAGAAIQTPGGVSANRERAGGRAAATSSNPVSLQARGSPGLAGKQPMATPEETKKAGERRRGAAEGPALSSAFGRFWASVPSPGCGGGGLRGACGGCRAGQLAGGQATRSRGPVVRPPSSGRLSWGALRASGGAKGAGSPGSAARLALSGLLTSRFALLDLGKLRVGREFRAVSCFLLDHLIISNPLRVVLTSPEKEGSFEYRGAEKGAVEGISLEKNYKHFCTRFLKGS